MRLAIRRLGLMLCLTLYLALGACGQTGELYLPEDEPAAAPDGSRG